MSSDNPAPAASKRVLVRAVAGLLFAAILVTVVNVWGLLDQREQMYASAMRDIERGGYGPALLAVRSLPKGYKDTDAWVRKFDDAEFKAGYYSGPHGGVVLEPVIRDGELALEVYQDNYRSLAVLQSGSTALGVIPVDAKTARLPLIEATLRWTGDRSFTFPIWDKPEEHVALGSVVGSFEYKWYKRRK